MQAPYATVGKLPRNVLAVRAGFLLVERSSERGPLHERVRGGWGYCDIVMSDSFQKQILDVYPENSNSPSTVVTHCCGYRV